MTDKLREALDTLRRELPDLYAAAIPTKSKVYTLLGWSARKVHDAIETITTTPSTTVATAATPADARGIIDALEMCAFQLEQIAAPHMHGSVPGALAIQCGIKAKKAREIIAALPKAGRMPLPNMFDPAHDEAIDWVAENCMAIRRDNGDMDYSFGAMIAAYEAGKAAALPKAGEVEPVINDKAVVPCPVCEGEGEIADGLDEAACSMPCPQCDGNAWLVDLGSLYATPLGLTERYRAALTAIRDLLAHKAGFISLEGDAYKIADEALATPEKDA